MFITAYNTDRGAWVIDDEFVPITYTSDDLFSESQSWGSWGCSWTWCIELNNWDWIDIDWLFDFDYNWDWEVSTLEAIRGLSEIPGKIIWIAWGYIEVFKKFATWLWDFVEPEYENPFITFFVPSTNAWFFTQLIQEVESREESESTTPIWKYSWILKYWFVFLILILLVALFINQRNKND